MPPATVTEAVKKYVRSQMLRTLKEVQWKHIDVAIVGDPVSFVPKFTALIPLIWGDSDSARIGNQIRVGFTEFRIQAFTLVGPNTAPDTYENNFRHIVFQDKLYPGGSTMPNYGTSGTDDAVLQQDGAQDVAITSPLKWENIDRYSVKRDEVLSANPLAIKTFHEFKVDWGNMPIEYNDGVKLFPQKNLVYFYTCSQNTAFVAVSYFLRTWYQDA